MTAGTLVFRGFSFPYNPEKVELFYERQTKTHRILVCQPFVEDLGVMPRVLNGEGTFIGEQAQDFYENLVRLFEEGTPGMLAVPHGEAFLAIFTSLRLAGRGESGRLHYQFSFLEQSGQGAVVK